MLPSAALDNLVAVVRGGTPMLRQQLADSLLKTGEEMHRARSSAAHVRAVLEQVPSLEPEDPLVLANAYGFLAAAHLGTFVAEPGPNECIGRGISDFDRTRVDAYLARAEAVVLDAHPPYIREWILRLRGLQLMREGRYPQAQALIEKGLALNEGTHVRFAAAQIAFLRARAAEDSAFRRCDPTGTSLPAARAGYGRAIGLLRPLVEERYQGADWYLRETLHSLARDRETHRVLTAVLRRQPDDASALENLKFVCNEYLLDFVCSFGVVKTLDSLGLLTPEDTSGVLDAVEIALLAGEHRRAIAWQRWLTPETLNPVYRLVDAYYRLWIAAETLPPDSGGRAFQYWLGALQALRSSPARMTWSFRGVRHTTRTSGRFTRPCAELLLQMIDAMEWPDRLAPTWTAQCGSR